jgi:hypothetical protein
MPYIQVPPDSTGKLVETEIPNAVSSLHREVMIIGSNATSAMAPVTSSAGLLVNISSGTIVSASSGLIQTLSSGPILVLTSGALQVLTSGTLVTQVAGTSGGIAPVTTSGGVSVTIVAGAGTGSTAVNLTNYSGAGALVTSSAGLMVNLSSSPGIVSASSGVIATYASTGVTYTVFTFNASSSGSLVNLSTASRIVYGWNVGSQVSGAQVAVRLFDSTTATIGSTTNLKLVIPIPGSTAGAGNNHMFPQGVLFSGGVTLIITDSFVSTSTTLGHSAGEVIGDIFYI